MEVFIFNAILYTIVFLIFFFKSTSKINFFLIILFTYALVAWCGFLIWDTGIYQQEVPDHGSIHDIQYIPYVLMFIMMMLVFWPIKELPKFRLDMEEKVLTKISIIFFGVLFINFLLFINAYSSLNITDFSDAYHMNAEGDIKIKYDYKIVEYMTKLFTRLSSCIYAIFLYLQFYCISKKIKPKTSLFLLSSAFILHIIPLIAYGSRGGLFFSLFGLIFIFSNFIYDIPEDYRRKILGIGFIFLVFMGFYALLISISRAGDDTEIAIGRIFRYFAEPFLNLGLIYWRDNVVHLYGIRFFPSLAQYAGIELPDIKYGVDGLRDLWTRLEGFNMYYFKTLFGDLYIEFGVVGAYIVTLILAVGAQLSKKIKNPFLCHLILFTYASQVVVWGIFGFGISQGTVVNFAYMFIFWIIFSKVFKVQAIENEEKDSEENKTEKAEK